MLMFIKRNECIDWKTYWFNCKNKWKALSYFIFILSYKKQIKIKCKLIFILSEIYLIFIFCLGGGYLYLIWVVAKQVLSYQITKNERYLTLLPKLQSRDRNQQHRYSRCCCTVEFGSKCFEIGSSFAEQDCHQVLNVWTDYQVWVAVFTV